ncbi:MAG TPA: cytochrome c oxidase subunit II [Gaiellaceae bacterium]|nr:cytochrome c oxidase subunit II [Gaiellaceae bacterium]
MRRKLFACSCSLAALAVVLTEPALAGNGGFAPPEPESPNASGIRDLYLLVLGVTTVIFLLVEAALIFFVVRFRRGDRRREVEGPQIIGHRNLELIWTAVPVLILAVIAGFVFYKLPGIQDEPEAQAASGNLEVRVEGRQFFWRFVYPNGAVAVNELRVPVGRVVSLDVTAPAGDVIHSWWIPQLGGKIDAIPGKTNHTWFKAEAAEVYKGQCAEYCGAQHALMLASVRAVPEQEFARWVSAQAARPQGLGEQTFAAACAPCHGEQGQGLIGPPLGSSAVIGDVPRLRTLLLEGGVAMPAVGRGWDERQLRALIAYVQRTFRQQGAASGG